MPTMLVGDIVYIKAVRVENGFYACNSSQDFIGQHKLEGVITERELLELKEKAEKNFTPVVGEEYEFSVDGEKWIKDVLDSFYIGFKDEVNFFKFIRPISKTVSINVPEKHKEAVEAFISSLN